MYFSRFAVLATAARGGAPSTARTTAVTVTSMAPGAAIFVDERQVGVTPARVTLLTRREHEVTVRSSAGEHTCRVRPRAAIEILGIFASPDWLVDLLNGRIAVDFESTIPDGLAGAPEAPVEVESIAS